MCKEEIVKDRLCKKAAKTTCRFKISAAALNHKDEVIGIVNNSHRFVKYGGGLHAERKLMDRYGKNIKTIIILRIGNSGNLLPIEPCKVCKEIADKLNIKIISIYK